MSKLKEEYNEVKKRSVNVVNEIKQLENSDIVKRYLDLKKECDRLYDKQISLYSAMKHEEYDECKHILVYSKVDFDRYEGRTYRYRGCIKCGLDNSVLGEKNDYLLYSRKIMSNYLQKKHLEGITIDVCCDIDLATSIYSKIKEAHPNIDDKTAIKYFEIALDNIRNIEVNDERKVSRAKRLSLNPKFRKWNGNDICNG